MIEEVTVIQPTVIDTVLLILSDPFMCVSRIDILNDCSSQVDIDYLKSFADAQYGLFLFYE